MPDAPTPSPGTEEQIQDLKTIIGMLNAKLDATPLGKKYQEVVISQYDEQIAYTKYRINAFDWALFASNAMLWTTVLVVFSGILFSGYQLYYATKLGRRADGTFEVSATRLKITTSIVGIVVLAMSIAFVIIFVEQVYTFKPMNLYETLK